MHVVFIEPRFPVNQSEFVRGLREVGAEVSAIGETPVETLSPDLHDWLTCYAQVGSVCDERAVSKALRDIDHKKSVDRLEATVEAHILPTARVREVAGIPGTSVQTAYLCRDKPAMKQVLREAGIATAQSIGGSDVEEIIAFAREVGFPLIVKPRAGAGAAGTHHVENEGHLSEVLSNLGVGRGAEVAVEEFVDGHEAFYDTLTIGGDVVVDFMTHYYPNVLDAMRSRDVSPQFLTTNRIDEAGAYEEVRELGKKVIDVLGIETSATHMEWFFGSKGLRFSEIGCRPPGVRAWDLYCAANDMDLYREWAMCVVHGRPSQAPSRRFSAV